MQQEQARGNDNQKGKADRQLEGVEAADAVVMAAALDNQPEQARPERARETDEVGRRENQNRNGKTARLPDGMAGVRGEAEERLSLALPRS